MLKWFNQTEERVPTPRCREDAEQKFDINLSPCKILLNSPLYCVPLRSFNALSAFQISLCLLIRKITIGRTFMFILHFLYVFYIALPRVKKENRKTTLGEILFKTTITQTKQKNKLRTI